jgi:thioredoxin 1
MAIREGIVLYANPGALPEAQLAELVAKIRAVDMDDVRAQVAAQAQASDSDHSPE